MSKEREAVIKHLEMIQGVINRMAHISFLIKGWSITISSVVFLFLWRIADFAGDQFIHVLIIPFIFFWLLDSYYLRQERLFRKVYDNVRQKSETDFSMDTGRYQNERECKYLRVMLSRTLLLYHSMVVLLWIFLLFAW